MTFIHKGIRRDVTDVLNEYGMAHYVQNVQFKINGEVGRRPGFGKSSMAKIDGPVKLIGGGNYDEPYIVQIKDNGTVVTTRNPTLIWGDPPLWPPDNPPIPPCTLFNVQSDNGTVSRLVTFNLPANCCASTVTMIGMEAIGRVGTIYGYTFVITADGVNIGATGCLVDDSGMQAVVAGTRIVTVNVTGDCVSGSGQVGTWEVSISQ